METKVCSVCKIEKPLSEFYRRHDKRPNRPFRKECKACQIKQRMAHQKDPNFRTFWGLRARYLNRAAEGYSIDEKVSGKELQAKFAYRGKDCYWCGRLLAITEYTFDHLISLSRGGHNQINNIEVCCPTCNRFKNTQTPSEFLTLIQRIASHHNLLAREG